MPKKDIDTDEVEVANGIGMEWFKILDENGTQYRVGEDKHGWFTIESGELHIEDRSPSTNPEAENPVPVWSAGEDRVNISPSGVEDLKEILGEY